jgi:hypothetical protein
MPRVRRGVVSERIFNAAVNAALEFQKAKSLDNFRGDKLQDDDLGSGCRILDLRGL